MCLCSDIGLKWRGVHCLYGKRPNSNVGGRVRDLVIRYYAGEKSGGVMKILWTAVAEGVQECGEIEEVDDAVAVEISEWALVGVHLDEE